MDRAFLQDRRVWIGGGAIIALILAAAAWFMMISPKLDSADSLDGQNQSAQDANNLVAAKNAKLLAESKNLDGLKLKLAQAVEALPGDSGLADFTRQVTTAAAVEHVTLTTIAISAPTAQAAPVVAQPTTSADASSTGGTGTSTSTTTTPATTAAADTGTETIGVTLTSAGSLAQQTAFLRDLQDGPRRLLVNSSQVSVGANSRVNSVDSATTMTTQVTIFTSPATASQLVALKAALATK